MKEEKMKQTNYQQKWNGLFFSIRIRWFPFDCVCVGICFFFSVCRNATRRDTPNKTIKQEK